MSHSEFTRHLIHNKCGRVVAMNRYFIPALEGLSLSDEQVRILFEQIGATRADIWKQVSPFISKKGISDRQEGARQFIIEKLRLTRCPVQED